MTTPEKPTDNHLQTGASSTLPFDVADLMAVRVRPADFARMVGVTKQTVSQWIQHGKVTLGPDGKLDPNRAAKQVINNSDPSRLRARVLKGAVEDVGSLRKRMAQLEADLTKERQYLAESEEAYDWLESVFELYQKAILENEAALRQTNSASDFAALVEALASAAMDQQDMVAAEKTKKPAYRDEFPDCFPEITAELASKDLLK